MQHMIRLTIAMLGGSLLSGTAGGDFLGLVVEEDALALDHVTLLTELEGYSGERVFNVYAEFDTPTDVCKGVVGTPTDLFLVRTVGGSPFLESAIPNHNAPLFSLAQSIASLNWDSFRAIGLFASGPGGDVGGTSDETIVAPGTPTVGLGGDGVWGGPDENGTNMAWTVPPTICGKLPTPQSVAGNFPGNRVLVMRLAVPPGEEIVGEMGVLVLTAGGSDEVGVELFSDPEAPGACCTIDEVCIDSDAAECDLIGGTFLGLDSVCGPASCEGCCAGDGNCDGVVDMVDLEAVIENWGCAEPVIFCPGDVNVDGLVDVLDLVEVITGWGLCP